jgi:hypothetical protein
VTVAGADIPVAQWDAPAPGPDARLGEEWLTVPQAARHAGVSVWTMRTAVSTGLVPAARSAGPRGWLYVRLPDVLAWQQQRAEAAERRRAQRPERAPRARRAVSSEAILHNHLAWVAEQEAAARAAQDALRERLRGAAAVVLHRNGSRFAALSWQGAAGPDRETDQETARKLRLFCVEHRIPIVVKRTNGATAGGGTMSSVDRLALQRAAELGVGPQEASGADQQKASA